MTVKIGFTGTREGMSGMQLEAVRQTLERIEARPFQRRLIEFHHGDCIGADQEAARVAAALGMRIITHPPIEAGSRAFTQFSHACDVREAKPYLERNRAIVDECELLVAAPKGPEQRRSGTWTTVRYARKRGKSVIVIDRFGEHENRGGSSGAPVAPEPVPDPVFRD